MDQPTKPVVRPDWFRTLLSDPSSARLWLGGLGVRDAERGARDLRDLEARAGSADRMVRLALQLDGLLPRCPDPGMALTNLERFVAACPDPAATVERLATVAGVAETVVQVFSTSQYFSELLIGEPALLDWLHSRPERPDRAALVEELWAALGGSAAGDEARLVLRRFRRREMLRIGYNDVVRGLPLEVTTQDLSALAEASIEGACRLARRRAEARHGEPVGAADGRPARFVVLGLGKLGGRELNYSSDIDLIFLYDAEGQTRGPRVVSNAEFFARTGAEVVRLLSDHTALGVAYRVDLRLRPEGDQGALARSLAATLGYYETTGRTWERQALIKCRPVAGDLDLGETFLEAIAPFVYRRYLGASEIGEIKAMKRRIEQRTLSAGTAEVEVKTGHGGIRDVEFVVQFLQLLHGGATPSVRDANTLDALARLEQVGCLSPHERAIMDDTYRFLRRVEHRLQIMFDRQTHQMPRDLEEQRSLAVRMGYPPANPWEDRTGPAQRFLHDYRAKTDLNRRILNHLLHDAFRDDDGGDADPVVDLVLDPDPGPELVASALARYPFRDPTTAYQNLMALAREDVPFLSQERCRHFLAAIAARLLQAVSRAPDPDMALTNLEKVSASLGAKAILWELFNHNPPTLRLYVELCATSQFLSEVLINSPGMIDDLMDSLVADRALPAAAIRAELAGLCKGAEDLGPILLGFRNKEWVRVGTRDILGRAPTREVTRELADVAEAVVSQAARDQWRRRVERHGVPRRAGDGRRDRWAVVALGKLGGRELNYHSDLDLVFLHEAAGATDGAAGAVSNDQFVAEVVRGLIRALAGGPSGPPLYAVDTRLRPHGTSGPLAVTLDAFRDYFHGPAQVWERMALTRARVIVSTGGFGRVVTAAVRDLLVAPPAAAPAPAGGDLARAVLAVRRRLRDPAARPGLKRGDGGITDVEFVVQYLQLAHGPACPDVLRPNLWDALDALHRAGVLPRAGYDELRGAYDFWRTVEGRLRIVANRGDCDLPDDPDDLARLARRLHYGDLDAAASRAAFRAEAEHHAGRVRAWFRSVVGAAAGEGDAP